MGLLDDAIREHLELKRRHGAPEGEVTRLETEVFGQTPAPAPAPEEPAAADAPDPAGAPPSESAEAPEGEPAPTVTPAPAEEPQPVADDPEPPHGDVLDEVVPEPPAPRDELWLDDPDEVPAEDRLDHPRRQPTTEFTPDDHASARGETDYVAPDEEPAEDVLEETPEFLQETPEHDRLWFEQRPPRDFDFGG